jgi:endo-1,4-beta-mannosidase
MEGKVTATNYVIPHTHCDLYSYSAYDTALISPQKFREALDYLALKAPDSKLFGSKNIFVGEFGVPENVCGGPDKQLEIMKSIVETALDWGARYFVYWELYCNEQKEECEGRPKNSDMRGFWLIRPDGTKPPVWDYFAGLFKEKPAAGG